jgi:hypothetical protein
MEDPDGQPATPRGHRDDVTGWDDVSVWAAAGLLGGLLAMVDPVPYVRDIVRGTTRPHCGTWLIWSTLGCTALASQWAGGGGWSLVVLTVQAVSTTLVFVLSTWRGVGGVSPAELALLGVAGLGVAGWAVSSQPVVATVCVLVADAVGVVLMLPKTWRDPWSETASTFALAAGSGVLGTVAVGELAGDLLLYPAYFAVVNAVTAGVILGRRRSLVARPSVSPDAELAAR